MRVRRGQDRVGHLFPLIHRTNQTIEAPATPWKRRARVAEERLFSEGRSDDGDA